MKFNGNIIGLLYNINNFKLEKYWKRTKEKYLKRIELQKVFKELEREKRKIENEKLREKEKKEEQMFNETFMKRTLNISKKEEYAKEIIFRHLNYNNHKIQNKENVRYIQNETKDKLPIIDESSNPQGFPKIDNIRVKTEENKPNYLIKNKKIIRNSFSVKKMNNKLNKIINSNVKPKIRLNNNKYFKSSQNFFKLRYTLPKLEMQTNPKYNKKENKNLDTNNNKKNDNLLTKEHTKKLKEITKKENIKTENMVKMKEKEKEEKNSNRKGRKNEGMNGKALKKIEKKEEIGKYNIFNIYC
jgi:hypothetical protein